MRILLIGGTGFMGPFVVRGLVEQGHDVAVFHRGNARPALPAPVRQIIGDRNDLAAHRAEFERLAPDVVLDLLFK
jgi:nucleoside-diphosphate-sugar epimerase